MLHNNLKTIRKRKGFKTAADAARVADIPPASYTRYEADPMTIPLYRALHLCDLYECSLDILYGREEYQTTRQPFQMRYANLTLDNRRKVEDYIEYLEYRETRRL